MSAPTAQETAPVPINTATVLNNMSIYLLPEQMTPNEANEKARPGETPTRRAERVAKMAASIRTAGQTSPVRVIEITEDDSVRYEYVDGGSRVDAIALINDENSRLAKPKAALKVWCSIIAGEADLFQIAVVSNLVREGNGILELCAIVKETAERNGWAGKRGENRKVADYLSMPESRVSELKKIGEKATPKVKAMIASGELASIEAVLRLVGLPDDKIESIADRAVEIAKERAAEKAQEMHVTSETGVTVVTESFLPDGTPVPASTDTPVSSDATATTATTATTTLAPVTATTSDVRTAASEQGESIGPLSKKDLLDYFAEKVGPAYPESIQKFCEYFVDSYAKGLGTDRTANKLFDIMTLQSAETKATNKLKAKEAADLAKAEAKAAEEKSKKRGPKSK